MKTTKQVGKQLTFEHSEFPAELNEILNCVRFWNAEGLDCHVKNNPNYTKGEAYEDFILRCIAADCRAFVEPKKEIYLTGKGGNHVWIQRVSDNHRILMVHF